MPSISIHRIGTSDEELLRRNFVSVLQDHFNPQGKQVPSFDQAIASRGIDEKKAIRNLRRRANYHQSLDRPKFFACAKVTDLYVGYWKSGKCYTADVASHDLVTLKHTTDTAAYVSAWCRLNHLKEA